MTIAAGFCYKDGVLLFADSQFTVGSTKMDGLKLGHFKRRWGSVSCAFAGNVDFASAVFQSCERSLSDSFRGDPIEALREKLGEHYKSYVLDRDSKDIDDLHYELVLGIKLQAQPARLYTTADREFREITTFTCGGCGSDLGLVTMKHLHRTALSKEQALSLAIFTLATVKRNVDGCDGPSVLLSLEHDGRIDVFDDPKSYKAIKYIENASEWFTNKAEQFMLTHVLGTHKEFMDRLTNLNVEALHMRDLWDGGFSPPIELPRRSTKHDWPDPQP
jgi:hypothetical protein